MARTVRARLVAAAFAALACGASGPDGEGSKAANDAAGEDGASGGDPLLARARQSMKDGAIDPAIVQQLLASEDPAHARARRLLRAMARQARGGEDEGADTSGRPALKVTEEGAGEELAASPADDSTATAGTETGGATDEALSRRPRAVLRRISLRDRKGGMTLTLHASGGVLVGTAHQRQSGTLRLVVESVGAEPSLLRSRPSKGQVEITDIRRGQDTVIITVRVPPGWRVGRTRRFGGGARIDLVAP